MHSHTLLHICTLQRYKKFQVLTNILPKTIIFHSHDHYIYQNQQELSPLLTSPLGEEKGAYP